MLGIPPGMAEFIAKMGLQDPAKLATMLASRGIAPPATATAPGGIDPNLPAGMGKFNQPMQPMPPPPAPGIMAGGLGTQMAMGGGGADQLAQTPTPPAAPTGLPGMGGPAPGMTGGPQDPGNVPIQPTAPNPAMTDALKSAQLGIKAAQGMMEPSAASGGGGLPQAPGPFIPGALASQMPDILKLLMGSAAPTVPPSLGSMILGR